MANIFDLFQKIEKDAQRPSGPVEWIIAGLGNPGAQYEGTRHNVGFAAVEYMGRTRGFAIKKLQFQSLCGECVIAGRRALVLKPSTYMNLSGRAVTEAMRFYKIPIERVLVIHDDVSLAAGRLRIRAKGSDGGHNGLKNIIYLSGENTFPRIKLGVGQKPRPDYDLADWVLSRPGDGDRALIEDAIRAADKAAELILGGKIEEAMSRFNR